MNQSIDLERLRITIDRWEAAAEATDEHLKKLELLLPKASSILRQMNNITGRFEKPLQEATKEAIGTYRKMLAQGAESISQEAKALTAISKQLKNESERIEEAADRIRVFSVVSVGLSALGIGLIAGVVGLIYGIREGYPMGYDKGFSEGMKAREYQSNNEFLNQMGLKRYDVKRDSAVLQVMPGYKLIGKQLDEGYFIRVYK